MIMIKIELLWQKVLWGKEKEGFEEGNGFFFYSTVSRRGGGALATHEGSIYEGGWRKGVSLSQLEKQRA